MTTACVIALSPILPTANACLTQTPKPVIAKTSQNVVLFIPPGGGTRGRVSKTAQWTRQMAKFNPFQFLQEVRSETSKVTWPTRKEVMITTAMVFVLVIVASIFFTLADQIIRVALTTLGIGR
jgi:preprotein translocase subunit SecE